MYHCSYFLPPARNLPESEDQKRKSDVAVLRLAFIKSSVGGSSLLMSPMEARQELQRPSLLVVERKRVSQCWGCACVGWAAGSDVVPRFSAPSKNEFRWRTLSIGFESQLRGGKKRMGAACVR